MVDIILMHTISKEELFSASITDRINIVAGDSGLGKTRICNQIDIACNQEGPTFTVIARDRLTGEKLEVFYYNNSEQFTKAYTDTSLCNCVFIIDEYTIPTCAYEKITHQSKYLLSFNRDLLNYMECGVNSVFDLRRVNEGDTKNKKVRLVATNELLRTSKEPEVSSVGYIITEDSKVGFTILRSYFEQCTGLSVRTAGNNSKIEHELSKLSKVNKTIIVMFDYDIGGTILYNMIESIKTGKKSSKSFKKKLEKLQRLGKPKLIRKVNVRTARFINMECFEQVLCFSPFILSSLDDYDRDRVLNFELYMNANYRHRGDYFLKLLDELLIKCGAEKYDKGFIRCFNDSCIGCNKSDCKLRMDVDLNQKLRKIFSGKYGYFSSLYDYLEKKGETNGINNNPA